jgi:hypothetical protein
MIKLDINYDPGLPDCMQGPSDYDVLSRRKEPTFPYRHLASFEGVSILGLKFCRKHVVTRGFDPYAGTVWKVAVGNSDSFFGQVKFSLSSLVCYEAKVGWTSLGQSRHWRVACDCFLKDAPWWFRTLWDFLEYRWEWFQHNQPEEYWHEDGHYYE